MNLLSGLSSPTPLSHEAQGHIVRSLAAVIGRLTDSKDWVTDASAGLKHIRVENDSIELAKDEFDRAPGRRATATRSVADLIVLVVAFEVGEKAGASSLRALLEMTVCDPTIAAAVDPVTVEADLRRRANTLAAVTADPELIARLNTMPYPVAQ